MKTLLLICVIILSFTISAEAIIRNVPAQHSTIQLGIIACSNGDTLLVQPGTYFENINFRGKKIVLTSMFYQTRNYSFIHSTIINGSTPVYPDSASCVIINNQEDSTTILQGFTITGGKGTIWNDEHFAGLYREGGGILSARSSPLIQYNIITGNSCMAGNPAISTGGGGMRLGDGFPRVYNNVVINNTARYGGGIVLNYTGGEYRNNLICKNYGSVDYNSGTGMWLNGSFSRAMTIENNTIVSNTALGSNPGISGSGVPARFRNNIVWGNVSIAPTPQISGNAIQVRYCNVEGGFTGAGNINVDPLFDSTNYYLENISPCVDKGDSSLIYNDPADPGNPGLANWPAKGGLRNDIGAYGGPGSMVIANTIVGIITGSGGLPPDVFSLKQNYPNPFNPATTIEYFIQQNSFVSINIYNILGQKIAALINKDHPTGLHSVTWNGADFNSGIYFYELQLTSDNKSFVEKRKMILLK